MSDLVAVTDHIKNFSIEKEILGDYFENKLSKKTSIILVWHKLINKEFLIKYPFLVGPLYTEQHACGAAPQTCRSA